HVPPPGHESRDEPSARGGVHGMTAGKIPRSEHEVRALGKDRIYHARDLLWPLTAVPVEEDSNASVQRHGAEPREARRSVAAPRLADHAGSGIARHAGRRVSRAVVHDDHLGDRVARRSTDKIADHGGLVQRRYDQDRLHPALARSRKLGSQPTAPLSFTAAAIASGATSKSLAHTGIVHGSERKKL